MNEEFERAIEALRRAEHVVVFTGAGVSAESGIPTFRDDEGFWRRFPMDQFGTWRGLVRTAREEPKRLAEFVRCVIEPIAEAQPNAAHLAIAAAEASGVRLTVVTQNIDRLHQRAGSSTVFELHGSLYERCGGKRQPRGVVTTPQLQRICARLRKAERGWLPLLRTVLALRPILGIGLRGVYKPALVLFGDAMAQPAWSLSRRAAEGCDCLLQIGTSGVVYPAAMLPEDASLAGAKIISIDPEQQLADIWLKGTACEVVPRLFEAAFG
ncbi:SIR2 family NAD-dependent protein deacylase [Botrimarina mediterranea]|uniref:protein acetyllysine N-acetyltransferase n=1 Tax=Botrimarina mediterranea TaxID=2528022 RepID=A0A518KED2_9BACT|nr:Sir2 family NAD-dependent protein deacetylase [Botrimarina mediterranea]QDV76143.1 NAD-dependent protein deacylase [Botrimarina mediterranea]QDV80740.1 NAD-dependent protein deacylase [Planctomycetes bacterium K2D]